MPLPDLSRLLSSFVYFVYFVVTLSAFPPRFRLASSVPFHRNALPLTGFAAPGRRRLKFAQATKLSTVSSTKEDKRRERSGSGIPRDACRDAPSPHAGLLFFSCNFVSFVVDRISGGRNRRMMRHPPSPCLLRGSNLLCFFVLLNLPLVAAVSRAGPSVPSVVKVLPTSDHENRLRVCSVSPRLRGSNLLFLRLFQLLRLRPAAALGISWLKRLLANELSRQEPMR